MRTLQDIASDRELRLSRRSSRSLRREALRERERARALETEIERLREELDLYKGMAYLDHLTGLRNRRYFEERLEQELSRARRSELPCSVLVADVDDFKRINDEHGHATGDLVLKQVGALLLANQRTMDIACRIGGDEFAIILPATDLDGAKSLRSRLEQAEPGYLDLIVPGSCVRLSFGTATYPYEVEEDARLLEYADRAMYADKRARKDPPQDDGLGTAA
jgi:diguanylate cyclase (GGDEF)-like protein